MTPAAAQAATAATLSTISEHFVRLHPCTSRHIATVVRKSTSIATDGTDLADRMAQDGP